MLVLTRKTGEAIEIGDGIFIKVLSFQGHCVRIGIEAPKEINIRRTELPKRDQDFFAGSPEDGNK